MESKEKLLEKLECAKEKALAECDYTQAATMRDAIDLVKQVSKNIELDERQTSSANKTDTTKLNTQPKESLVKHKRNWLEVVDIWLTLQGEGPFHGKAAVFIRTAGCNLECNLCDSDYTSNRKLRYIEDIYLKVKELAGPHKYLVVITGGEPLRQNKIGLLCSLLVTKGYPVQIETNGTYWWDDIPNEVTIVCSPKTPKLHPKLRVDAFKYVLEAEHIAKEDGLPTSVLGNGIVPARPEGFKHTGIPIYVAPADERDEKKNEINLRATIRSVFQFNYILSLQEQKYLGMP